MRGQRGPGNYEPAAGAIFPFGSWHPFGIAAITGAVVTVAQGEIEWGTSAALSVSTDITIASDGQYIGLEYDRSAGTLTVTGPHDDRPVSSGDVVRTWLYVFELDSRGQAELVRHNLTGIRLFVAV
jgi:hypothetical protein